MRDFIRFIFMSCLLTGVGNVSAAKIGDYEITTTGPDGVLDFDPNTNTSTPVSYTHLTLPTIYSV